MGVVPENEPTGRSPALKRAAAVGVTGATTGTEPSYCADVRTNGSSSKNGNRNLGFIQVDAQLVNNFFLIQTIAYAEDQRLGLRDMIPVQGIEEQLDIAASAAGLVLFH